MVWKNKQCCTGHPAVLELLLEDELTIIPSGIECFHLISSGKITQCPDLHFLFELLFFFLIAIYLLAAGVTLPLSWCCMIGFIWGCRSPLNPSALFPLWFDNQSFGRARTWPQCLCLWRPLWSHGILVTRVIKRLLVQSLSRAFR